MNTQKGFLSLLGLLLVVAVIGGGTYFYTQSDMSLLGISKNATSTTGTNIIDTAQSLVDKKNEGQCMENSDCNDGQVCYFKPGGSVGSCVAKSESKDVSVKQEVVASISTEESASESFKRQRGEVKSLKDLGSGKYLLTVDLLTLNPEWDFETRNTSGYSEYLNLNPALRTLTLTNDAKIIGCPNLYELTEEDWDRPFHGYPLYELKDLLQKSPEYFFSNALFFDIEGSMIIATYEQCERPGA